MSFVMSESDEGAGAGDGLGVNVNDIVEVQVLTDEEGDVDLGPNATVSPLWRYFEVVNENVPKGQKAPAKCTIKNSEGKVCAHICKRTGGNTSSMKSHLKAVHPASYAEFVKKTKPASFGAPSSSEKSGKASKQSRLNFTTLDRKTTEQCALAGAYFIAVEALPYSLVDSDGFRRFIEVLRPGLGHNFPGRRALTENYVPRLFAETVDTIKTMLKEAEYVSLTADGWTSGAKDSFIGATVHFINMQWELISANLGCMPMEESHTASNLADFFDCVLQEWEIKKKSVSSATVDNGANFVAGIREIGVTILKCLAHSLQLAIDLIYEHEKVKPVVKKVKLILSTISGSPQMQNDMFQTGTAMGTVCVALPLTCKTRWWTLLRTMRAVKRNLPVLRIILAKERRVGERRRLTTFAHLIPNFEEEEILDVLLKVLTPLESLTEALSSENYVTGSGVVPLVSIIDNIIVEAQAQTGESSAEDYYQDLPPPISAELTVELGGMIKKSLVERYIDFSGTGVVATDGRKSYRHMVMASFVDPRFKDEYIKDPTQKADLKQWVIDECVKLSEASTAATATDAQPDHPDHAETNAPKKLKGLAAVFSRASAVTRPKAPAELAGEQVESYLTLPLLDMAEDPLTWWKDHQKSMPLVAKVAKKYLCSQGTSVPCERVFSRGGQVVTDFRTCLSGEHVNQLVFLSVNRKYVNLPKKM